MRDASREAFALTSVGYGLFMLTYGSTAPALAFISHVTQGWGQALLVQFAFFASTGVGYLAVHRYTCVRGAAPSPRVADAVCAAVMAACFAAAGALAHPTVPSVPLVALTVAAGFAASHPLVFWFNGLCGIYRAKGRMACIAALACSGLVTVLACALSSPLRSSTVGLACALVAFTLACALCRARINALHGPSSEGMEGDGTAGSQRYRLTAYTVGILSSLGVTVGLTWAYMVYVCMQDSRVAFSGVPALILLALFGAVVVAARRHPATRMASFGLVVRVTIAVTGLVLALLPLLAEAHTQAAFTLIKVTFALLGIVMMLFSIEVSCENGVHVLTVMPVNYALYALMACLSAGAFWALQTFVGGHAAWDLTAALGVLATVAVIPLLPSTSSNAVAITLEELPENEGREQRLARLCAEVAREHALTEREAEVLGLMLAGLSRQQIAERLTLSVWTVKDYMSAIYRKAGVHSYQELVGLMQKGGA